MYKKVYIYSLISHTKSWLLYESRHDFQLGNKQASKHAQKANFNPLTPTIPMWYKASLRAQYLVNFYQI